MQFLRFAQEAGTCIQALSILTVPQEIVDTPDSNTLVIKHGKVTFNNVNFHYNDKTKLFQNINVEIAASTKVGLIGFSGSDKTTFVNLILRFFDVQSSCILIDDQDSLHEKIAMIPQNTSMFHRSLMENIRYGSLNATDEVVITAAKKSHCHEFITTLPDGYQSLVGERGIKLSVRQRQHVAIARAILKNAPILI